MNLVQKTRPGSRKREYGRLAVSNTRGRAIGQADAIVAWCLRCGVGCVVCAAGESGAVRRPGTGCVARTARVPNHRLLGREQGGPGGLGLRDKPA